MTESRFPRVVRCVGSLVLRFQPITSQDTAKSTGQKYRQSLEQIDESGVIGSLCADGLGDKYERVGDSSGND